MYTYIVDACVPHLADQVTPSKPILASSLANKIESGISDILVHSWTFISGIDQLINIIPLIKALDWTKTSEIPLSSSLAIEWFP